MGHILGKIEIEILRNTAEACEAAVEKAAKEIKQDLKERVFDQAVLDYYSDYPKPSIYKRTEGLYKAFKGFATVSGQEASISVKWNFNWLPKYKSRSKRHKSGGEWISRYDEYGNPNDNFNPKGSDNGIPEKGWILTNFFEGIHPRYFFDKDFGLVDDSAYFEPSYERIKRYKDDYIENDYAKNILIKHLHREAQKYI